MKTFLLGFVMMSFGFSVSAEAKVIRLSNKDAKIFYNGLTELEDSTAVSFSFQTFACDFRGAGAGDECLNCKGVKAGTANACKTCPLPTLTQIEADGTMVALPDEYSDTLKLCELIARKGYQPDNSMGGYFSYDIKNVSCTKLKLTYQCRYEI